ncbi:19144_t:CDS:2, partial [Racocetra fulgida]
MLKYISDILSTKQIIFDYKNQYIRCIEHIINLAVKQAIKKLYINTNYNSDDDILENDNLEELNNIVYKQKKNIKRDIDNVLEHVFKKRKDEYKDELEKYL